MSIVDLMMHKFLILFTAQDRDVSAFFTEDLGATGSWLTIVNLAFIILFIMTPMLTGYYLKGSGGAILSKVMGTASTIAYAAAGISTFGASTATKAAQAGVLQDLGKTVGGLGSQMEKLTKGIETLNKRRNDKGDQK
jgi:hypothetical protein